MRRLLTSIAAAALVAAAVFIVSPEARATSSSRAASTPTIVSVAPAIRSAGTGSIVTIRGSGFGTFAGGARVEFTYQEPVGQPRQYMSASNVLYWTSTRIVCEVPTDNTGYARSASSGPLRVVTADGATSKGYTFTVTFSFWWRPPEPIRQFTIISGNAGWRRLVRAAGRTWTKTGHFRLSFADATSGSPRMGDGINQIYWGDVASSGALAVTQRVNGETDIVFNKELWWGSWVPLKYDVQSIALHELGHVVGLRDLYGKGDRDKVMYGWSDVMGPSGSFLKWTWGRRRQLTAADIAGVRWVNSEGAARGKIAFARKGSIWTVRGDGTDLQRLTSGKEDDRAATWSPDHSRITFIRGRWYWDESETFVDPTTLWMVDSDGSNLRRVSYTGPSITACGCDLAWSPDGRYIAGASLAQSGDNLLANVTVLDLQTMTSRVVSSLADYPYLTPCSLDWSPDMKRLAVCTCWADPGPTWVIDVATGKRLRRFNFSADGAWGAYEVSWKPDGTKLLMNVDHSAGHRSEVWSPSGRRLLDLGRNEFCESYSRTGQLYAFIKGSGGGLVSLMRARDDGKGVRRLLELDDLSGTRWK